MLWYESEGFRNEITSKKGSYLTLSHETKTGRCSEWSMLFGAMLSSLGIKTRIVHDFLDHCWNEAMLSSSSSPEDEQWVHVDSTLTYPISLNHPFYYEQNWGKKYEYVLAFSAYKVEDVTKRYTQRWETIEQRRHKNNNNSVNRLTTNRCGSSHNIW